MKNNKRLTTEEFIEKSIQIHGERYDYTNVKYINAHTKVKIICLEHGEFNASPTVHLKGHNCPSCSGVKKSTTKDFIEKANIIHGNKFDYSEVKYLNNYSKIKILCLTHGEFEQKPNNHLNGQGCPLCVEITTEQFIEKAKEIHGDQYNYFQTNYIAAKFLVKIECLKHGIFEQTPSHHLLGHGCKQCANELRAQNQTLDFKEFETRSKKIHKNFYSYDEKSYVNTQTVTVITCPKHGTFKQIANNHLKRKGCPKCGIENLRITTDEFVKRAKKKHKGYYDYSKSIYFDSATPLEIICPKHGSFKQVASYHLSGRGCPRCKESRGEKAIRYYLQDRLIDFKSQSKYDKIKKRFIFDFIMEFNGVTKLIEFNGIQHYCPTDFGSKEINADFKNFYENIRRDYSKYLECEKIGVQLIFIPYWDLSKISAILDKFLVDEKYQFSSTPNEVSMFSIHRKLIAQKLNINNYFFNSMGIF
jgi:Zn finger protein HypA/HybF involved in hydrogenase expression